jgi:hypothetical protein
MRVHPLVMSNSTSKWGVSLPNPQTGTCHSHVRVHSPAFSPPLHTPPPNTGPGITVPGGDDE